MALARCATFRLAAHPPDGAAGILGGFLTLKTKHDDAPFFIKSDC
jgi:hypothetical protein